ncbi:MAG: trehalose-phosphatase [Acidobacteriota bacterium]
MKILNPQFDLFEFINKVRIASKCVLMINYDGTLAPFCVDRNNALPYPGMRELLTSLTADNGTRLIVVSGRSIKDIIPLLGLPQLPEIWGSQGLERLMPDKSYQAVNISPLASQGLSEARDWAIQMGLANNCEEKVGCLAIHLRGLEPKARQWTHEKIMEKWLRIAQWTSLKIQEFDGGIELRISDRNKGYVVNTVLAELEVGQPVAYLGDDLSDEEAFKEVKRRGLSILVNKELRTTNADLWLQPPTEVFRFLCNWVKFEAYTMAHTS